MRIKTLLVGIAAAAVIVLVLSAPAFDGKASYANGNYQYGACGCHSTTGTATVSITPSTLSPTAGQQITYSVLVSGGATNGAGLAVVIASSTASSNSLPSNAGWTIVSDPSGTAFNMNKKSGWTGSNTFTWTLKAPTTAGTYSLYTKAVWSDGTEKSVQGAVQTFTVGGAVNTAPSVSLTSPANGATVSGTTNVQATVTKGTGTVTGVVMKIDGTQVGSTLTASPYTWSVDTRTYSDASHTITVTVTDSNALTGTASATVTFSNPHPVVAITAPANGATVSGTTSVTASVTPGSGTITGVVMKIDGMQVGSTLTASPYTWSVDTRTYTNASHTITVTVTDSNTFTGTATGTVTFSNPSPVVAITAPTGGSTVTGTTTVTSTVTSTQTMTSVILKVDGAQVGSTLAAAPYSWSLNTQTYTNGAHTIQVVATDSNGRVGSKQISVTVSNAAPTVAITAPANGATVSGTVPVSATVTGPNPIASVVLRIDGNQVGTALTVSPYGWSVASSGYADGSHVVNVTATDSFGKQGFAQTTVTVNNAPPVVTITGPTNGAVVKGTVSINATVTSVPTVSNVQFLIGGVAFGNDTAAPYQVSLDTTKRTDGQYTILVRATNANGVSGTNQIVLTINNQGQAKLVPVVTITSPANGATVGGTTSIGATVTSTVNIANVQLFVDGTSKGTLSAAPYAWQLDTNTLANGMHTVNVTATDTSGGKGYMVIQITSNNAPPVVSILSPSTGNTVSGTITVQSSITTAHTVSSVTLRIDGNLIGTKTASPWTWTLDTTAYASGQHVINVTAIDGLGHSGSAQISVNVDNSMTAVTITAPTASSVKGTFQVTASVTASRPVKYVDLFVDGQIAGNLTAAPYTWSLDSTAYTDGQHTLRVLAVDANGKSGEATKTIAVSNAIPSHVTVMMTGPTGGSTVYGSVNVTASVTSDRPVASVRLSVDGTWTGATLTSAPYKWTVDTTGWSDGQHTLAVTAGDDLGNASSAHLNVVSANAAPVISIASPTNTASLSGTVSVNVTASGPGIHGLTLNVDGTPVGTAPGGSYVWTWDTTAMSNGQHYLNATALANNGKAGFAQIAVTVSNAGQPAVVTKPTVKISSPANGAAWSGIKDVGAVISAPVGVSYVRLDIDGSQLDNRTVGPFSWTVDTRTMPNGHHSMSLTLMDLNGAVATASQSIDVKNVMPSVSVLSLKRDMVVSGHVPITTNIVSGEPIKYMLIRVDGVLLANLTQPDAYDLNSATLVPGTHVLNVTAVDEAGKAGASEVTFSVADASASQTSDGSGSLIIYAAAGAIVVAGAGIVAGLVRRKR